MSDFAHRQVATAKKEKEEREQARHEAALTLMEGARNLAERRRFLDMLGLPPFERPLRSSPKWKKGRNA